jgi:hypothetical protein
MVTAFWPRVPPFIYDGSRLLSVLFSYAFVFVVARWRALRLCLRLDVTRLDERGPPRPHLVDA